MDVVGAGGEEQMSDAAGSRPLVACAVTPMLSVRNGARAVEFYKTAFGAAEVYRVEDPGGSVVSIHSATTGRSAAR